MKATINKILVVDDNERWRRFASLTLRENPQLSIIGEAADGLEAIQKAKDLQPDLIVLDIGLPKLNGLETARRIRSFSSPPRILILSQESSLDIVAEAVSLASGYVVKSHAGGELLRAVLVLLNGGQYISAGVGCKAGYGSEHASDSSPGLFRVNMDLPMPTNLPEDEQIQQILCESYVADCNEAQARMYGLNNAQEWIGTRLSASVSPEEAQNVELTRQFIRSGYRVQQRKSYEVDARGNRRVFLNSMTGIIVEGKLIATWGMQSDVTEQENVGIV